MQAYLLAIDQGTTNSRAIVFDKAGELISQHEIPLQQYFPNNGWVEQDPEEMFTNTVACCREAIKKAKLSARQIAAIGISNQRETTILWHKETGKPIYPAIVWQDRRTHDLCQQMSPLREEIGKKTGLVLDPYFSATKIMWILENVPGARKQALQGTLLFGTVDSFLLWKLTKGKIHATDITNAARTLLFNIHTQQWDEDILQQFNIPRQILPTVCDNTTYFGDLDEAFLAAKIPITGMAGDQQAAAFGQACFAVGMVKATYGSGCFMLLNTGNNIIASSKNLLSTIAYRINKQTVYCLEGSIFSAGVTIKWLRDNLKIINSAAETAALAQAIENTGNVYLVPAFTGLGAPYWDPQARGAILGLTRNSGKEQIVRAALESVAYQSLDLLKAMISDSNTSLSILRVDGGMVANTWLMQFLSDMLNLQVQQPKCIETTALGAAYLAGLQVGIYQSIDDISALWQMDKRFIPDMPEQKRIALYDGWKEAIERVRTS